MTVALLAAGLGQVLWLEPLGGPADGLLYALVLVPPLAWRRARPEVATLVASSTMWIPVVDVFLWFGHVVLITLFFSLGRWAGGWRWSAPVAAYGLASGTAGTLMGPEAPYPALVGTWLVICAPYLLGRLMAAQEQEAADLLEAERVATRRQAVDEERARIVRELHDVVGHEVTLLSIQSEAAAGSGPGSRARGRSDGFGPRDRAPRNREPRAILDVLGDGELSVAPDPRGLAS